MAYNLGAIRAEACDPKVEIEKNKMRLAELPAKVKEIMAIISRWKA